MQLVGREAVIARLEAALADAAAGRGQLIVLAGEPGIGKSTLADAVVQRAGALAASQGRAWEFADSPPYFAVRPCLRDLGVAPDDAPPFELWEDVLDALAHAQPRLWIVEDAHAADLMTLDLLAFLARPIRTLPVLIIVTRRDRDPRLTPAAEQRLVRMARDGARIDLEPLDAAGTEQLAAAAAERRLPPTAVRRLVELSGGNPLFIVECARAMHTPEAALPATLRQVVLDRAGLLDAVARETLSAAAVLGRELGLAVLARILERSPAHARDALAPAIRAGLIAETAPGELAFSHAIVRDVIDDETPRVARVALHRRAVAALAELPETPATVVERARHTLEATTLADAAAPSPADDIAIVDRAIALLAERGAHDRAFALGLRLDGARRHGLTLPDADRLRVAQLAVAAGQAAEVTRLCGEILDDARARGDRELFARAVLVLGAEIRPTVVDPRFIGLLEEARAGLPDGPLACRIDARLAAARQPAPDRSQPIALAEAAIAAARTHRDPRLLCEVIDVAGAALVDFAPIARRLELGAEGLALARSLGDHPRELRARARAAFDLVQLGNFAGFLEHVGEMLALSLELGHPRHRWRALLMASMAAVADGRLADSERLVVEVEETAATVDEPALRMALAAHIGQRMILAHDHAGLRRAVVQLKVDIPHPMIAAVTETALRAAMYARLDDREATATQVARLMLDRLGAQLFVSTTMRNLLVEPVALVGTDAVRRLLLGTFDDSTPDLVAGHMPNHYDGPTVLAIGRLRAALGERAAAERALREALALCEARGLRLWVAQIAYELGRLVRDDALLARAADLAQAIGMTGLAARIGAAPQPAVAPAPPRLVIAREGDAWSIRSGATHVRVRHTRGIELLARLVERPGEELHVLALASDEPGASLHETAADTVLDERARRAYRSRLADLDDDIAAAAARGDTARGDALERERDALVRELARATGLGTQPRKSGSASERARINVQRRIKDAIARIAEADTALGAYLDVAVRTGTYCSFRP